MRRLLSRSFPSSRRPQKKLPRTAPSFSYAREMCDRAQNERRIIIPDFGVEERLNEIIGEMWVGLQTAGFYTKEGFLGNDACKNMRGESESLFLNGKFFQSQSLTSSGRHFSKPGVHACELDGSSYEEWEAAPHLLAYTREVILTLPAMLNNLQPSLNMSTRLYGTKLAVATGNGSKYPKHVDNNGEVLGEPDLRKLTFIYYLNPGWRAENGGALRVWDRGGTCVDTYPEGDRLFVFWSDDLVHEVLANEDPAFPRYALTLWLVTEDKDVIKPKVQ